MEGGEVWDEGERRIEESEKAWETSIICLERRSKRKTRPPRKLIRRWVFNDRTRETRDSSGERRGVGGEMTKESGVDRVRRYRPRRTYGPRLWGAFPLPLSKRKYLTERTFLEIHGKSVNL